MDSAPVPSTSRAAPCAICTTVTSKYTCPRCNVRTCSLPCTQTHKTKTGCSGQHERTSFVDMAHYGDVAMWRDMSFLREVGDKVKDFGATLAKESSKGKGRASQHHHHYQHGNHTAAPLHERVASLPQKELNLKKKLGARGVELLFLPSEMERHKANKTAINHKQRKLFLTVTVSEYDASGRKVTSKTTHNHELEAKLSNLLSASSSFGASIHTILLPVPMRPSTYIPRDAQPIIPARIEGQKPKEDIPLPAPPSSLPAKPTWAALPDVELEEPSPETIRPKIPVTTARKVWLVQASSSTATLEDALRGTAVLEWPEFEIWPASAVDKMLSEGTLEYAERRDFDPDRNRKRKRELEGEDVQDAPADLPTKQEDGTSTSSESSDSSDSDGSSDEGVEETRA